MSLSVRLHGDRTKARSMAEAHVSRLIQEFRRLNEFQNLKQNTRRVDLYDGENLAGWILLKTVFGAETVEVYAMPAVTVKRTEEKTDYPTIPMALFYLRWEPKEGQDPMLDLYVKSPEGIWVWNDNRTGHTDTGWLDAYDSFAWGGDTEAAAENVEHGTYEQYVWVGGQYYHPTAPGDFFARVHCLADKGHDFGNGNEGAANVPWTLDIYVMPQGRSETPQPSETQMLGLDFDRYSFPAVHQQLTGTMTYWNTRNYHVDDTGADWRDVALVDIPAGSIKEV